MYVCINLYQEVIVLRHNKINGKLLNLEKKWHHLSCKQKEWIYGLFRNEYIDFLNKNKKHPNKEECKEIVNSVFRAIKERDIWISLEEVRKAFSSKLCRYRKIDI